METLGNYCLHAKESSIAGYRVLFIKIENMTDTSIEPGGTPFVMFNYQQKHYDLSEIVMHPCFKLCNDHSVNRIKGLGQVNKYSCTMWFLTHGSNNVKLVS